MGLKALAGACACALLANAACAKPGARNPAGEPPRIDAYLTTGDRTRLLSREPGVHFGDSSQPARATIDVDPRVAYQEIVGFGAALTDASAWLIQYRLSPSARDALLRELFGREPGIGFSFVRIDMGASDFSLSHYSYHDVATGASDPALASFSVAADSATIAILKHARTINPQLRLMASPWSAPAWMKTTGSMIRGTLRPDAYAPFARYFEKFIDAYAALGIPIYAISVQNEPHHEPDDYPGMRLDPAQRARFIGEHLGPLFERRGFSTRILEWDHNWDEPGSPLAVLADSVARRYVAGVAWHCYAGDVSAQSVVHLAYPAKEVYFTECSGGEWAPSFADNLVWTVRHLIIGATRHWARGVLMWNIALDENHGPHTGGCGNCRGVVTIRSSDGTVARNEEYYAFAHASRFVRPGARRVASTSGVEGIESVAFQNADDDSLVLIALNTNAQAKPFAVRSAGRAFTYTLPPSAVVTFRWR